MAILLDVIAGPDPEDPATARSAGHIRRAIRQCSARTHCKGARLGVLRQVFTPDSDRPAHHRELREDARRAESAPAPRSSIRSSCRSSTRCRVPPQTPARLQRRPDQFIAKHPGIPYPSVQAIADSKLAHPLHQAGLEDAANALPAAEDPETIEGLKNEQRYREAFTKAMDAAHVDALVFPDLGAAAGLERRPQYTDRASRNRRRMRARRASAAA